ncbi:MAG: hypothetical protein IV100_04410 [Myxococcales bacterium]|nr:hypothetical protein [Myxococcales bacterium]
MKRWSSLSLCAAGSLLLVVPIASGCAETSSAAPLSASSFSGVIGAGGGSLSGEGAFAGVVASVPPGAFAGDTTVTITSVAPTSNLPETAASVGPMFAVTFASPPGKRVSVTLPVDLRTASAFGQDYRKVKVWFTAAGTDAWERIDAGDTAALDGIVGSVTVGLDDGGLLGAGVVLGDESCDGGCPALSATTLSLTEPTFGTALASTGSAVATLRVVDEGGGTALHVVTSPIDGGAPTLSAPLPIDAAADAWPARGLALRGGDAFAGLRTGLASFPNAGAPTLTEDETLAVVRVGIDVAWIVAGIADGERVPAVRLVSAGVASTAVPLVQSGSSKPLTITATSLASAPGESGFVLGLPDRMVVVSVEDGAITVADVVPLGGDAVIDAVTSNWLLRDRDGYVRNEKGLVVEDTPPLGALVGTGDHVVGTGAGGRSLVLLTSDGVAPNPFEPAPFRLESTSTGSVPGLPLVAIVEVDGDAVVGLDTAGQLRRIALP